MSAALANLAALLDPDTASGDDLRQAGWLNLSRRSEIEKAINGALISAVDAHGPIERANVHVASKRMFGALKTLAKPQPSE